MKLFLVYISIVLIFSSSLLAQVPNGGFENWTAGEPDLWVTNNSDPYYTITQSNSSHSGILALKGECIPFVPPFLPVIGPVGLCDGNDDDGFPIEFRYNSLKGFYIFNPQGGDQILISVYVTVDTAAIGVGGVLLNEASSYTEFAVPITYIDPATPNRCIITFQILNSVGVTLGSEMYLDDLQLSTDVVSVNDEELSPTTFQLKQNYPNPFNPITTINYSIPNSSFVKLVVYNSIGQEIANLVNETIAAGNHNVEFNASNLTSGIYFYSIQAGDFVQTRKMIFLK
ncbi:MAG: T9SS type A sorting domain-containing protein [Ignavibacterium sp.]|jgi:hypothetical protein|nr:T9SS type A sorting domain-containing protein [Ignavibacterium sp.]